jgi:hypothetical protein
MRSRGYRISESVLSKRGRGRLGRLGRLTNLSRYKHTTMVSQRTNRDQILQSGAEGDTRHGTKP